jgi:hypothetical protein
MPEQDEDVKKSASSKEFEDDLLSKYPLEKGYVDIIDGSGNIGQVKEEDYDKYSKYGYRYPSRDELVKEFSKREYGSNQSILDKLLPENENDGGFTSNLKKYATLVNPMTLPFALPIASNLGIARGATGGLSDVALTKTGIMKPRELKAYKEENPTTSFASEVIGGALPAYFTKGKTALATIGRNAAYGAASAVGNDISEAVMEEKDIDGEWLMSTAKDAMVGGAVGGAFGILSNGLNRVFGKFKPSRSDTYEKLANPVATKMREKAPSIAKKVSEIAVKSATTGFGAWGAGVPGAIAGQVLGEALSKPVASTVAKLIQNRTASSVITGIVKGVFDVAENAVTKSAAQKVGVGLTTTFVNQLILPKLLTEPEKDETDDEAVVRVGNDIKELVSKPTLVDEALGPAFIQFMMKDPTAAAIYKHKVFDALIYLSNEAPSLNMGSSSFKKRKTLSVDRSSINRYKEKLLVFNDPFSALEDVLHGKRGNATIDALEKMAPSSMKKARQEILAQVAERKGNISLKTSRNLERIFRKMPTPDVTVAQAEPEGTEKPISQRSKLGSAYVASSKYDQLEDVQKVKTA